MMISRRILAAVVLLCATPAHAQFTKAQLDAQVTANLPDNTSFLILPSNVRTVTSNIINSILPTAPVVSGNTSCFDGTTGLLKDCGVSPTFYMPTDVRLAGAKCDGTTDDHVAIQTALNTYKSVLIPGVCSIGSSTLTFGNLAQATITGINSESSQLTSTSTTAPMISVVAAVPGLLISHLGLTRSAVATAGATGILFNGINDNPVIDDVEVQKQYIGVSLSSTGFGKFRNSYIHNNVSDGVVMQNPTVAGEYQWYLDTVLSEANGGWGYHVIAPADGSGFSCVSSCQVTMGTWTNSFSFSNTSGGSSFNGNSTVAIQGIRIDGGFWGTDGGAEGHFDTFNTAAGPHQINNLFAEINTNGTCLDFTGNNNTIGLSGGSIIGCNTAGITNSATSLVVNGAQIINNTTYGIVNSGTAVLSGSNLANNTSGTVSNSGTYTGRGNTPSSANTAYVVTDGGTGVLTMTAHGPLIGEGTSPIHSDTPGTNGQLFLGSTSADPAFATMAQDCTITNAGVITCLKTNNVAFSPAATALAGQLPATATNDSASAGNLGEYVESVVTSGSPVSLVNATPKDITTISLTAGDWDVEFIPGFTGGVTTTVNYLMASISLTANTLDQTNGRFIAEPWASATIFNQLVGTLFGYSGFTVRMSLSTTTTIHAVDQANFSTSTCSAFGVLRARRVR